MYIYICVLYTTMCCMLKFYVFLCTLSEMTNKTCAIINHQSCVKSGEFTHFFYHNQNTSCILPFMWILNKDTLVILPKCLYTEKAPQIFLNCEIINIHDFIYQLLHTYFIIYIMIGENIACSVKFHEEIAQFIVHSWDFVRKMHGWAILLLPAMWHTPLIFYGLISCIGSK